jgi:hypothetical protein
MNRSRLLAFVLPTTAFACAGADGAYVISDRAFFSGIDHTFLNFEARGDGTALNLAPKQVALIPSDEYASVGIRFATSFGWAHVGPPPDSNASMSNAVDAAGSWPTIVGGVGDTWVMEFVSPVRAIGMGVIQGSFGFGEEPGEDITVTMTAFDADGNLLGRASLWTDTVDGGFGGPYEGGKFGDEWSQINYGFLGLATETPIARLEFTNAFFSNIDDLHVSAIPAPGAGTAFALLGLGAGARRKRGA